MERTTGRRGIDSEVAEYRSPSLVVLFDYGEYGGPPSEPGWRLEPMVVDGRTGILGAGRYEEEGAELPLGVVAYIPDSKGTPGNAPSNDPRGTVISRPALTISARCRTEQDCRVARRIFESVRFMR